jgi:hypothetical protein
VDIEISKKDAKAAVSVRPVQGQQQHIRRKLEERRAPRFCRAQEQMIDDVQPGKIIGRRRHIREGHFSVEQEEKGDVLDRR